MDDFTLSLTVSETKRTSLASASSFNVLCSLKTVLSIAAVNYSIWNNGKDKLISTANGVVQWSTPPTAIRFSSSFRDSKDFVSDSRQWPFFLLLIMLTRFRLRPLSHPIVQSHHHHFSDTFKIKIIIQADALIMLILSPFFFFERNQCLCLRLLLNGMKWNLCWREIWNKTNKTAADGGGACYKGT